MHRDFDIAVLDIVLMALGPPLLGAALGLLIAWSRSRPVRAALGGASGATVGAWIGLAIYRMASLPVGRDHLIFEGLVFGGLLLGAVPPAWLLAGPALTTAAVQRRRALGCGLAIGGILLSCLGFVPYQMGSEASAHLPVSGDVKDTGIAVLLLGLLVLVLGLLAIVIRRTPAPHHFVMVTRQGCHLCEQAWALLESEQRTHGFTLEAIDVDSAPELAQFGDCVPVVLMDGKVRFRGQVNPVLLKRLLN